ncbi:protein DESIGUAL 2 [Arachis duranensis]|uniref:Protein DESIGUAL 2 n=1 Tax=Arachis duranensis TaxID=130453 RepID=A0A6P4BNX0_ARADU|nr:protein DESIGUAL 2 [Arachis duranensis]
MTKNYGFLICILVMVMDIIAGILGIQAEIAQNKEEHMKVGVFECRVPSYEAFKLGLAATVLLALAHVIANLLGGCICVWSRDQYTKATANRQLAVAFLIFSWMILAVAFSMLIIGTLANSRSKQSCNILNHRLLSIGGVLCFIHGLFVVPYYVSATATRREESKRLEQPLPIPGHT